MGIIERLKEEFNFFKNDENYYKSIYYSLKDRSNIFEECFKLIVNDLVISWNSLDIDWFIFSFKTLDKNDIIDTLYYYLNIFVKFNLNLNLDMLNKIIEKYPNFTYILNVLIDNKTKITKSEIKRITDKEIVNNFLLLYVLATDKFIFEDNAVELGTSDDSFKKYLQEIRQIPVFSEEEEKSAFKRLDRLKELMKNSSGDELVRLEKQYEFLVKNIVEHNLRLVVSIARKLYPTIEITLDLIQDGNMGLMKAVEKFDYEKGYKFSTYAKWWIKEYINRFYFSEFKDSCETVSLDGTFGKDDDSLILEKIKDNKNLSVDEYVERELLKEEINKILDQLSPLERDIITMRFGLNGKTCTYEEIAKKHNVSRVRIKQIEERALSNFKTIKKLFDFYEGILVPINLVSYLEISSKNLEILAKELYDNQDFKILFTYYGKRLNKNISNGSLSESEKILIKNALRKLDKYINELHKEFKTDKKNSNIPIIQERVKVEKDNELRKHLKEYLDATDEEIQYLVKVVNKKSKQYKVLVKVFGENLDLEYNEDAKLTKEEKDIFYKAIKNYKLRLRSLRKKKVNQKKYLKEYLDATDEEVAWLNQISDKDTNTYKTLVKIFGDDFLQCLVDYNDLTNSEKGLVSQWISRNKLIIDKYRLDKIINSYPFIYSNKFFKDISIYIPKDYQECVNSFLGFSNQPHSIKKISIKLHMNEIKIKYLINMGIKLFEIVVYNYQVIFNLPFPLISECNVFSDDIKLPINIIESLDWEVDINMFNYPIFKYLIDLLPEDIKRVVKLRLGLIDENVYAFSEIALICNESINIVKNKFNKGISYFFSIVDSYQKVYNVSLESSLVLKR